MLDEISGSIDWRGLDSAHHLHPFTDHKSLHEGKVRVINSAEGVFLTDSDGNKILDGMAAGFGASMSATAGANWSKLPRCR